MFRFTHGWLCKLLLMCHRLELFIEKDEPGHRGAGFDLWQCIGGLKTPTPPRGELCRGYDAVLRWRRVHV